MWSPTNINLMTFSSVYLSFFFTLTFLTLRCISPCGPTGGSIHNENRMRSEIEPPGMQETTSPQTFWLSLNEPTWWDQNHTHASENMLTCCCRPLTDEPLTSWTLVSVLAMGRSPCFKRTMLENHSIYWYIDEDVEILWYIYWSD